MRHLNLLIVTIFFISTSLSIHLTVQDRDKGYELIIEGKAKPESSNIIISPLVNICLYSKSLKMILQ